MRADDRCPFHDLGTITGCPDTGSPLSGPGHDILGKEKYYHELKKLDVEELYHSLVDLMKNSQKCWPADGPQDGDIPNYAGLFGRLAWHCSGTFRLVNGSGKAVGGCEGARLRHWPENEWRDNANLDKARGLLGQIKDKFKNQISWADLMTFAGTVGIKASGGPAKKFCFGRIDDADGSRSVELGVEGNSQCPTAKSDSPCETHWRWPEQDETDHFRCNITQPNRLQASHSVGLIYVYPEGPQLKSTHPEFNPRWVHNRSPKLSALEVRDTFKERMGWTDRETVALIGGGHTLGRAHGNRNTVTSGFDGPWTRTPSQWNYDFFEGTLDEDWEPVKSAHGNDQWWTTDRTSKFSHTRRLTADMSLVADETYRPIVVEYAQDHEKFDSEFADAWHKLVHRSADHPHENDLEKEAGICTHFEFLEA
jgi:catalase (peroxidase I)